MYCWSGKLVLRYKRCVVLYLIWYCSSHLLLHLYILEDGMDSPGLRKHGTKRCCVPHNEDPCADLKLLNVKRWSKAATNQELISFMHWNLLLKNKIECQHSLQNTETAAAKAWNIMIPYPRSENKLGGRECGEVDEA